MLLRLVALGAAGYAGFKYLTQERRQADPPQAEGDRPAAADRGKPEPEVAIAGGPLSGEATLVHKGEDFSAA